MLRDTKLSIHDLLFSKLIAPENNQHAAPTIISEPKHSLFPWHSSTPPKNPLFSWLSPSQSTDSRIHKFRNILDHGPYNFSSYSYYNTQGSNLANRWCRKKIVGGRDFFSLSKNNHHKLIPSKLASYNTQGSNLGNRWCRKIVVGREFFSLSKNNHHKLILSKLASYRNSIVRLFDSKLQNYPTRKMLCNLNKNYLVPSPSTAIGIRSTLKQTPTLLLSLGAVRHYHNNRSLTLVPKYYSKSARFIKHVRKHKVLYMFGLGFVTVFLIGSWETIPYSKRKHFVIVPASRDKSLGNFLFKMREEIFVLPPDHPDSVRVRSISNQILQALQSDLKIKQMSGLEYSSKRISSNVVEKKEVTVPWWRRTKFSTGHLEGLNWEVVVVDLNIKNAYVLPGGKIVVYRGLLEHCKSDAQVATVIGHEVAHVVARHYAERFTKCLWFTIGMMIILAGSAGSGVPPNPQATEKLGELILNPSSRSNEKEADYIGLLLMASAAYDPREAPKVYEMLDNDNSSDKKFKFIHDLFSTHPSGKKRVAALSKPKVMEEAMTRFSKAIEATRREEEECLEGGFDVC